MLIEVLIFGVLLYAVLEYNGSISTNKFLNDNKDLFIKMKEKDYDFYLKAKYGDAVDIQSLYNVVDSVYVGKFSNDALTAVGLAWPMQNLIIALSTGVGVGINAILSKSLGESNQLKASKTAVTKYLAISKSHLPNSLRITIYLSFSLQQK